MEHGEVECLLEMVVGLAFVSVVVHGQAYGQFVALCPLSFVYQRSICSALVNIVVLKAEVVVLAMVRT